MKQSQLLLFCLCGYLLAACGGSSSVDTATHLSVTAPATATVDTAFQVTVTALDAANHAVTTYSGTVHFSSSDGLAVLPPNATLMNGSGTFSVTLRTTGSRTITATDTVTASITGISAVIDVTKRVAACTIQGQECGPTLLPCCGGLTCAATGDRAYCMSTSGGASIAPKAKALPFFAAMSTAPVAREREGAVFTGNGVSVAGQSSSPESNAASAPTLTPVYLPSMAYARAEHTATLLRDGSVLFAGGAANSSAELYDPADNTFALTGDLSYPRVGHTATLLKTGQVLIAGGTSSTTVAEIYDPSTGKFSDTGHMVSVRTGHSATLLPDGEVLLAGGTDASGQVLATAELYNPATGSFVATAEDMTVGRSSHTATLLGDGKVLLTGGPGATAELYDPTTGHFIRTGSMHAARSAHSASALSGNVLVLGGYATDAAPLASAELYNPRTGSFAVVGSMSTPRARHTATVLGDGTVLVAGGFDGTMTGRFYFARAHREIESCAVAPVPCSALATAAAFEVFKPTAGEFVQVSSIAFERGAHTATLLPNGGLLLAGGDVLEERTYFEGGSTRCCTMVPYYVNVSTASTEEIAE